MNARDRQGYVDRLLRVASAHTGERFEDLRSDSRRQRVAQARQAVMLVLRERPWSLEEIGRVFDRDHSTVHHAVRTCRERLSADAEARELVSALRSVPVDEVPHHESERSELVDVASSLLPRLDRRIEILRESVAELQYAESVREQLARLVGVQ